MLQESDRNRSSVEPLRRGAAAGEVVSARFSVVGPYGATSPPRLRGSPAQRAGIRYERKVQDYLSKLFDKSYMRSPWFQYVDRAGSRHWCQPDGIIQIASTFVIVEVKVRAVLDAWWKARRTYAPVIEHVYRPKLLGHLLICKYFDPTIPFPEKLIAVTDPREWAARSDFPSMGWMQWIPLR